MSAAPGPETLHPPPTAPWTAQTAPGAAPCQQHQGWNCYHAGLLWEVRTLIAFALLRNLNLNLHIALQKQKLFVETSWLAACLDEGPAPASSMPVGWPHSFQFQLHPLLHCQSFQAGFNSLIPSLPVPAPILCVAPLPPHLRRSAVFPDMKIRCVLQLNPQKAVYWKDATWCNLGKVSKQPQPRLPPKCAGSWAERRLVWCQTSPMVTAKKPGADLCTQGILQRLHTHALRGSVARLHKQSAVHLCTVHQALWKHPLRATLHTGHCVANEAFMMQTSAQNALCKHPLHARHPGCRSRWSLAEIQASLAETRFVLFH